MGANRTENLSGWGRYDPQPCDVACPESTDALVRKAIEGACQTYISRGLGRSYGDSAVNGGQGVILHTGLNRFVSFDAQTGVVECEAGVSLADIIDVFLPHGWFLPTTPGTKFVTVGGAIAADVHGKNHHHDGSFGNFVLDLRLLTAAGDVLVCSPSQNAEVFWATVGGMGLTGVVLSARIQLASVESAYYDVTYKRTANLDESLECFEATDKQFRYSVAWIDCLASGASLGRSVLMLGNDAAPGDLPARVRDNPLHVPPKRTKTVPLDFPGIALNSFSVKAFNWLFYIKHGDRQQFVDYDTYFYPLDAVNHWNRIYGRRGFIQYQALFPPETSRQGLIATLEMIAKSKKASFLAVLKSSGPGNDGMLSYLHPGHTLALDLANTGESLRRLVRELDEVLLKNNGRLYLAKDATTTADVFRAMYPRLGEFLAVKKQIDPASRFVSSQARRLGLLGS